MKVRLHGGLVVDTDDHDCARFDGGSPCTFCRLNKDAEMMGYYCVPFDIPGAYNKGDEPTIIVVKL